MYYNIFIVFTSIFQAVVFWFAYRNIFSRGTKQFWLRVQIVLSSILMNLAPVLKDYGIIRPGPVTAFTIVCWVTFMVAIIAMYRGEPRQKAVEDPIEKPASTLELPLAVGTDQKHSGVGDGSI